MEEDPDFHKSVLRMLRHADFGITDVMYAEKSVADINVPEELKDLFGQVRRLIGKEKLDKLTSVRTRHSTAGNGAPVEFDLLAKRLGVVEPGEILVGGDLGEDVGDFFANFRRCHNESGREMGSVVGKRRAPGGGAIVFQ